MEFPNVVKKTSYNFPAMAELKLDGELVGWDGYRVVNERGADKTGLIQPEYYKDLPSHIQLWGEMYYGEGKTFYSEVLSHQKELGKHKVKWFDLIVENGARLHGTMTYKERIDRLSLYTLSTMPCEVVMNMDEVDRVFRARVKEGYEGIVVKPFDSYSYRGWGKIKRSKTAKLFVVGFKKQGRKALLLATKAGEVVGSVSYYGWEDKVRGAVACMLVNSQDKEYFYLAERNKMAVEVEYQMLIPEHNKLRNPFIKRILGGAEDVAKNIKELI